jgi:hypothetical protein
VPHTGREAGPGQELDSEAASKMLCLLDLEQQALPEISL